MTVLKFYKATPKICNVTINDFYGTELYSGEIENIPIYLCGNKIKSFTFDDKKLKIRLKK